MELAPLPTGRSGGVRGGIILAAAGPATGCSGGALAGRLMRNLFIHEGEEKNTKVLGGT